MQSFLELFKLARNSQCGTNNGFMPGIYDNLCSGGQVNIVSLSDFGIVLANAVRIIIAFAGALAVIVIIIGGIMYIISTGDPSRLKQAKEILTQAVVGLMIILLSYGVITFISSAFGN